MELELKRIEGVRLLLIPASEEPRGHGTTGVAKFWKRQGQALLEAASKRSK